ncbi:MAG: sigma-54-dependent Fis family transcriptional regulator [Deltaproteobacteria bacterium]|nr:sigma-54-dependent Fis family transcriptional regulator [Deltaproteobacteria bacterium]
MRTLGSTGFGSNRPTEQSLLLEDNPSGIADHWRQYFPEVIGHSQAMMRVLETVAKIARSDSSVLILGESGTGKELIAAALHRLSHRSVKPYVPLNCSAIPDNLLESELFGHERGAFTGADKRVIGKFQFAEGGTIFLDEIGDMPALLQAKLLRVLQDKKFAPLGSNQLLEVNVRVVAATNMNLEHAMKAGTFRHDLYYRLNVLPIHLPALRDRIEDVPHLLAHFIDSANRIHGVSSPAYLSDAVIRALCAYQWPGNVRQLQNLVDRLVIMKGGGIIEVDDLPPEVLNCLENPVNFPTSTTHSDHRPSQLSADQLHNQLAQHPVDGSGISGRNHTVYPIDFGHLPEHGLDLAGFIESLENDLIRQALERTGNNRNQAAKLLGLNRTTLVERIKKRRLAALNEPSKEL